MKDILLSNSVFYLYLAFVVPALIAALWTRPTGPAVSKPRAAAPTTGRASATPRSQQMATSTGPPCGAPPGRPGATSDLSGTSRPPSPRATPPGWSKPSERFGPARPPGRGQPIKRPGERKASTGASLGNHDLDGSTNCTSSSWTRTVGLDCLGGGRLPRTRASRTRASPPGTSNDLWASRRGSS